MPIEKPIVKRIVCLANSDKNGSRCIAGKELINGQLAGWIRPISTRTGGEVLERECRYKDGGFPRLLDIIDVPLHKEAPKFHQKENWFLYPNFRWKKRGRICWRILEQSIDRGPLWIDKRSGHNNKNDRVTLSVAEDLKDSLRLIRVNEWNLSTSLASYGNRVQKKLRGKFCYGGNKHCLGVTDHEWKQTYREKLNKEYKIGDSFLTVSLAGCFAEVTGDCHLLIAGIILCDETSGA